MKVLATALLTLALTATAASAASAADFTVSSTTDAVDSKPGDGRCATAAGGCSLRAAVQEAEAQGGGRITVPAGRYRLTIKPQLEAGSAADMDASNGDIDLAGKLDIVGAGPGATVLDGNGIDRYFETAATATATLTGLTITGGDSTAGNSQEIDLGGGILNKGGITLDHVELVGNKADGGGGMFSIPGTMPVIRDSLIHGNEAFEGGGLRIDHGGTIVGTEITGNRLRPFSPSDLARKPVGLVIPTVDEISGYGGGIDHRGGATLTIVNSTITGNHAIKGGGGIGAGQGYAPLSGSLPLGQLKLRNTIIAGNVSDAGAANCRTNQVTYVSLGHNLASDASCFLTGVGDKPATDPRLGPLADNGGPLLTQALLAGSPAIDAGDATGCPKTDLRGVPRPQGAACDIGAFEHQPPMPASAPTCRPTVRLPAGLRRRARTFDVVRGGRVVARGRKPAARVAVPSRSRVTLRVHLRSGRTTRVTVTPSC